MLKNFKKIDTKHRVKTNEVSARVSPKSFSIGTTKIEKAYPIPINNKRIIAMNRYPHLFFKTFISDLFIF